MTQQITTTTNNRTRRTSSSSSMPSTANAFLKRRHPTSQERQMELQETVRLSAKRRRASHSHTHNHNHTTEEEESEQDYCDLRNGAVSTTPPLGVTVPRKPRSASVKRAHEDHPFSSSNLPFRNKMKSVGPKISTSKSSSSAQEDIEIEIAELLYGLKTSKSSSEKLEASDADDEKKKNEESVSKSVRIESDCNGSGHEIESSECPKVDNLNSGAGCGLTADGRSEFFIVGSPSCSKSHFDVDKHDSASTIVMSDVSGANSGRVDKFEIDLMAPPPPPMMLSPERDNLSRGEDSAKVEDKVEKLVKKEKWQEETEEVKMDIFKEKWVVLKLDLEKPSKHNDIARSNKLEEQDMNKEPPAKSTIFKLERTDQSSSVSLSTSVPEGPRSLSSFGYMPPSQTVLKKDKTTGSSTSPQHLNFILSQPRPKTCAIHHYIARNIFLHQQCTKMTPLLASPVSYGSLCDTKPNNVNRIPSAESMVIGKRSQKHLPGVNQNAPQEKGWAATSEYNLASVKSSGPCKPVDSTQMKQLVLQQGPHPGSTNLVHGPAFLFPSGQHQASVTPATSLAGVANSSSRSASSSNKSHSSAAGSLGTSSALPSVAGSMSFSYPNLAANDAPYVTIVQNSGYPFPFSTPLGASAAIRGASPAQATPIFNGSLYSSQMFHPLHHPQQQPHYQALVQPSYVNASTLSGSSSSSSSSSQKHSQGTLVNGNNILTSTTTMQLQQSQKQQTSLSHSHKHETQMAGENAPSVVSGTAYSQKNVFGQNYMIPVQPLNLSFRPSATSDSVGGNSGNFGDKQQQQQALKGGAERIPSQAFAISFAAFDGTSIPSNLNFSSMAQNPVIFQSLPDFAWQGYQAASASHITKQKFYSITEGKSGGNSSQQDDEKKTTSGKPSTNGPTTLVFDNSSKNFNFVSSPMNANWPNRSITSTATTTSLPLCSNASNSPQPSQLPHLQQQPAIATRYKASSTNATSATKFVNSPPVFSQALGSNQASQSKNSGRTLDSQVCNTSIITSAPTLQSLSQDQGRVLQGHTQISFGGNYISSLPPQGQQLLNNNQPFGTTVAGSPPNGGNLKSNSQGSKVGSSMNTSQMQQTENSSSGSGQKSSPVCGRNVPSILSSCPSHLSELKY